MIVIQNSTKIDEHKLAALLDEHGHMEYNFNADIIVDDIAKVNRLLDQYGKEFIHRKNLKDIAWYLEKLLKAAKSGYVKASWVYEGGKVKSTPIEIRRFKLYRIDALDYMLKDLRDVLVTIDINQVINAIAFEAIYREFMELEDVESKLGGTGITSIARFDKLEDIMVENSYELAMSLKITDSPYLSVDKEMYNYFGDSFKSCETYRAPVESACNKAVAYILQEVLASITKLEDGRMFVAGVFEDGIALLFKHGLDENTVAWFSDMSIVLKVFGRRFEIKPAIQQY